jgi:hypothetical protein
MQGVLRREWRALFKQDNAAEGGFSARPKGSPLRDDQLSSL